MHSLLTATVPRDSNVKELKEKLRYVSYRTLDSLVPTKVSFRLIRSVSYGALRLRYRTVALLGRLGVGYDYRAGLLTAAFLVFRISHYSRCYSTCQWG